jgi:hypothetical protein
MTKDGPANELAGTKRSDDQLLQMIDELGLWLVRGGPIAVLGRPTTTLRAALRQAHEFSKQGQSLGPIVRMPNDDVIVLADQIYRLWQSLGPADR